MEYLEFMIGDDVAVRLHRAGHVEFFNGYTPDAVARAFWQTILDSWPDEIGSDDDDPADWWKNGDNHDLN